jgi:hypothetical protein
MKHTIRIKRHVIRDIMASIIGGCFVGALIHWWLAIVGLALMVTLFIEERADIEEEEE